MFQGHKFVMPNCRVLLMGALMAEFTIVGIKRNRIGTFQTHAILAGFPYSRVPYCGVRYCTLYTRHTNTKQINTKQTREGTRYVAHSFQRRQLLLWNVIGYIYKTSPSK